MMAAWSHEMIHGRTYIDMGKYSICVYVCAYFSRDCEARAILAS